MTAPAFVQLVYTVNATGTCTAAQMATELQNAVLDKSLITKLYGATWNSQVAVAPGGAQAVLTITIGLTATFNKRFPSAANGDTSMFNELYTSALRAIVNQQPLASTPVFLASANLAIGVNPIAGGVGSSTTATATVTGTGAVPTGTVQFQVAGANVGAPQALVAGVASLLITNAMVAGGWKVGANNVTYTYSGDTNYGPGTSPIAVYSINP